MQFPIFRKYPDKKTYFRILSNEEFEEIKLLGGFYQMLEYKADKLPDRNLIEDMINGKDGFWEVCTEAEFEKFKAYCQTNYKKLD